MKTFAIALCACAAGSAASAATIVPGTYELFNHPDGNAAPPEYGLRLDGLIGGSSSDVFTFDFEHADASMLLTYDDQAGTIRIFGSAYGGLNQGSGYAAGAGLWDIDVTMTGVTTVPGDDDLWLTAQHQYIGDITSPTAVSYPLYTETGNNPYSFRLGDENNDNGHRGAAGVSGWGWVNHNDPNTHVYASDWLFTMAETPVPAPASLALLGAGGLLMTRRRKA